VGDLRDGEDEDEVVEEFESGCPLTHFVRSPPSHIGHESNLAMAGPGSYCTLCRRWCSSRVSQKSRVGVLATLPGMESRRYPTDLSDAEWTLLEPHLPAPKRRGRPRLHSPREILNAVFYVLKSGCQWRMLPHEFPPWKTVFHYFRRWRLDGTWEALNHAMRERLRVRLGRDPQPSAGIVDSQSVKTTGVGGEQRGFDGGKKVRGRKRHLLVDTEGLVVEARVHSAKVLDQDGIRRLLEPARSRLGRLSHLWVDAGYCGCGKEWVEKVLGVEVEVVNRSPKPPPERFCRCGRGSGSRRAKDGSEQVAHTTGL
jgi:putative transposase